MYQPLRVALNRGLVYVYEENGDHNRKINPASTIEYKNRYVRSRFEREMS